jgi:membrane fusion protein (multidrug efflux system)
VPAVQTALAQQEAAARALAQTEVTAPAAGLISQVGTLNLGQYVGAGAQVASLVETGDTWIEANFKETQIGTLRVGQPVDVEVDAWPGVTFEGSVESLGSATGSQFSLIPAQNATGNWVKVVQRLPVRIRIGADAGHPLRGGMSVTVAVDTGHSRLDDWR